MPRESFKEVLEMYPVATLHHGFHSGLALNLRHSKHVKINACQQFSPLPSLDAHSGFTSFLRNQTVSSVKTSFFFSTNKPFKLTMFSVFKSAQERKRERRRAYRQRRRERKRQNYRRYGSVNALAYRSYGISSRIAPPLPRSFTNAYRFVSRPWSSPASFIRCSHDQISRQNFEEECLKRLNEMYVMPRTTTSDILQRFRSDSTINASDGGCQVVDADIRVSLICPISLKRIQNAAIFFNCQHVQCFDALAFMKTYRHRIDLSVKCPVCSRRYVYNRASLWKSVFFQEILEHPSTASATEIRINLDETWQVIEDKPALFEV